MEADLSATFSGPHRKLPGLFNNLERDQGEGVSIEAFLEAAFNELKQDLRLRSALVYLERHEAFELCRQIGEPLGGVAQAMSFSNGALAEVLRHRVFIYGEPGADGMPWAQRVATSLPAAGLVVGRRPHRYVMFFLLDRTSPREPVDFALNMLRAAFALHLLEERNRRGLEQAREIQDGLLRADPPSFAGFELACRSVPADTVGGDFFDFMPLGPDLLGLAVGDASGHGLPAALLVRDIVTGLRMGLEKHLRMEYVFSKLNRVIHRSSPLSRYVGLFYAEVESGGNLSYVNAGHQPPLLFQADRVQELRMGGPVIGPLADTAYRRGLVRLDPGSMLLLFTDGLVERRAPDGEFFGQERLVQIVRQNRAAPARALVETLYDAAAGFGAAAPWDDDVTVMVLGRDTDR